MSAAGGDCRGASIDFRGPGPLTSGKERKSAFLDALRALQACGRLDEALAAADRRMSEWAVDTEVLLFLVHLAQAADSPRQAQHYAQLLVKPVASGPRAMNAARKPARGPFWRRRFWPWLGPALRGRLRGRARGLPR